MSQAIEGACGHVVEKEYRASQIALIDAHYDLMILPGEANARRHARALERYQDAYNARLTARGE